MSDPDYLALRGRLAQLQDEKCDHAARFDNAVDALRRKIILYETPADVDLAAVSAAVFDMEEQRNAYVKACATEAELRKRLGIDA